MSRTPLLVLLAAVLLIAWTTQDGSATRHFGAQVDTQIVVDRFDLTETLEIAYAVSPVFSTDDGPALRFVSVMSFGPDPDATGAGVTNAGTVRADASHEIGGGHGNWTLTLAPRQGLVWRDVTGRKDLVVSLLPL